MWKLKAICSDSLYSISPTKNRDYELYTESSYYEFLLFLFSCIGLTGMI